MILRRITEHVKSQNWFAVWLDFIIVVVGVFFGIQIGNWNASRLMIKLMNKRMTVWSSKLRQILLSLRMQWNSFHQSSIIFEMPLKISGRVTMM